MNIKTVAVLVVLLMAYGIVGKMDYEDAAAYEAEARQHIASTR